MAAMTLSLQSIACVALATSLLAGCANAPATDPTDPYENYNRTVYQFNDTFYKYVGTPINTTYKLITPEFFRTGVGNALQNVGTVPDMMNDALQWNWRYFGKDTLRLILNTTLGIFGLIDVAGAAGIPGHQQGFSYTLAKWGWVNSNYFMIPFLGPGTVSSAVSLPVNYFMSPLTYATTGEWTWGLWGLQGVQKLYELLPAYNTVNNTAVDPYTAIRNAFEQNRSFVLQQIETDGTGQPAATDGISNDMNEMSPILLEQMSNS